MRYIILLLSIFCLYGCSKSSSDNNQNSYSGDWYGSYKGDDSGSWNIRVQNNGSVTGAATSKVFSETFALSGSVDSKGAISITFGSSSSGGSFSGSLSSYTGNGTWNNKTSSKNYTGTWAGEKSK